MRYFFVGYYWRTGTQFGHGCCTIENNGFLNLKKTKDVIRIGVERAGHELSICIITNFIEMTEEEYRVFNEGSELTSYEVR